MSLFRPSHFPLGVIGIASCSQTDSLSSITAEFNAAVKDLFPPDCVYPLAKSCFVFEEGDGTTNLNLGDHLPGLVIIPNMMGNKKENIETLLADLCSNILAEFATIVRADYRPSALHVRVLTKSTAQITTLESPLGNEFLNASLFPSLPSAADLPKPLVDDDLESFLRLPSHSSQPELSLAPVRRVSTPILGTKRISSAGAVPPIGPARQTTLGVPTSRKRQSLIGAASSHGRLFKVLGDFFILAGRTEDATIWCVWPSNFTYTQHLIDIARYTEAVTLFKTANDPVWYASALEGLATIALLEAWSGQGFVRSRIHYLVICTVTDIALTMHTAIPH